MASSRKRGRIGVVAAAGGFRGISTVGFLEEMFSQGLNDDLNYYYGVSVSSLIGAALAEAKDASELPKALAGVRARFENIERKGPGQVFNFGVGTFFHSLSPKSEGLLPTENIKALFRGINPKKCVSSPLLFEFGAQSERLGGKKIFSNRDQRFRDNPELLTKALLGAVALQPLFPPVEIFGDKISDGLSIYMHGAVKRCDTIFALFPYPRKYEPTPHATYGHLLHAAMPTWLWNFVSQYEIQVREANKQVLQCAMTHAKLTGAPRIIPVYADGSPKSLDTASFHGASGQKCGDLTSARLAARKVMAEVLSRYKF